MYAATKTDAETAVLLVRAGVAFIDGVREERCQTEQEVQKEAA